MVNWMGIVDCIHQCIACARFKVLTQVLEKVQVIWHVTLLCK